MSLHAAVAPQERQPPFVERVEVARILIDARAFDRDGRPITDLDASDFDVEIGGRAVRVESAEWIGQAGARPDSAVTANVAERPQPGRLVVVLVQRDLEPRRILGLMQMSQLVDRLLAPLTREDRIAVVSFDSRLRIWTDFTSDLDRVRSILAVDVITGRPPPVSASPDVSLIARLERPSDGRIFGIEHALRRIGESLEPLPGAKTVLVLGYGFGRFNARTGGVVLMDGYEEATVALQRARVAVFTLNVTQANFNSLQAGLQTVSAETGGLYARTYDSPVRAIETIGRALAGHYVLFVERPEGPRGTHRIEVRLTRRTGTVVARSAWEG
jgi:VWFA-related protein